MKKFKYIFLLIPVIAIIIYLSLLDKDPDLPGSEDEYIYDNGFVFINTSKSVKYVGTETCKGCHKTTHRNFTHSEMYKSFGVLDTSNIIESYPQKAPVYDPETGYYYEMIKKDQHFFQREFRLDKKGNTVYERFVEAQFTIGSGNNLRMYFNNENGMLYQLPLTWYTFKQQWDLSPGFKETGNLRFNRYATKKCLGCHNSYMNEMTNAIDRFKEPFNIGIGCERCHGPGEIHEKQMRFENHYELPEKYKSIVNPSLLSQQRMISICMQCHLQGKAWAINDEDGEFDFRPGQLLGTNRSVYFPKQTSKEQIEVGDSPHRLLMSNCFKKSNGKLTCISCHDPHYSIKTFTPAYYNAKCINCHSVNNLSKSSDHIHSKKDNCISCHMNKTGKENTLHGVSLTDHWIRIDANKTIIDWAVLRQPASEGPIIQLIPDVDDTDENVNIRKGVAYVDYYFETDRRENYLDSAIHYLIKDKEAIKNSATGNYFLGEAFMEMNDLNKSIDAYKNALKINPEYAAAYFKLGNAYSILQDYQTAVNYYRNAVNLKPQEPPYLESLGLALIETGKIEEAINILKKAIKIDSYNTKTFYTLGYIYAINLQQPAEALEYFKKAVSLNPLIEDGFLNLGNTSALLGNYEEALNSYQKEISFNPNSSSAYLNSGRIYQMMGDITKAKQNFKKALEINPEMEIAKKYLDEL